MKKELTMETVYSCKSCGNMLFDRPTKEKGRCPYCWAKLYPNNYDSQMVPDGFTSSIIGKVYPAPSWEEDLD